MRTEKEIEKALKELRENKKRGSSYTDSIVFGRTKRPNRQKMIKCVRSIRMIMLIVSLIIRVNASEVSESGVNKDEFD